MATTIGTVEVDCKLVGNAKKIKRMRFLYLLAKLMGVELTVEACSKEKSQCRKR